MSEEQPQQVAEQPEAQEQVTDAQPDQAVQESEEQNFNGPRSREATPPPDYSPPEDDGGMRDLMVSRLYEDMGRVVNDDSASDPEPTPEPTPEATQEEAPQPEEAKQPEVAEEEPARRTTTFQSKDEFARELTENLRDIVRSEIPQQRPELPVPEPEAKQPEPEEDTSGLLEEQKMELELVEYAENQMPDKYKGYKKNLLGFYKELDDWISERSKEDESFSYENNAEQIEAFVSNNKPVVSPVDERKLERQMIRDQAMQEFEKKSSKKFKQLENKTRMIEETPKIRAQSDQFRASVLDVEGVDAASLIKEGKDQEAHEKYPMESQVAKDVSDRTSKIYEDYLHYEKGLTTFEQSKESLSQLDTFLSEQGQFFAKNGGDHRYRDGKSFLPVAEYNAAVKGDPNKASRHWTFDSLDVKELLAADARLRIKQSISHMEEQISKYGFVRRQPDSTEPQKEVRQQQNIEPVTPPKATVSPAPGQGDSGVTGDPDHPGNNIIDTLGLRERFPEFVE
jgi:hypothetical protein